jgi:hypothetical protein
LKQLSHSVKLLLAIRQGTHGIIVAAVIGLAVLNSRQADEAPVVFWVSETVSPGDVVMAYGGNLLGVRWVEISRLPDLPLGGAPKAASNGAIQEILPGFRMLLPVARLQPIAQLPTPGAEQPMDERLLQVEQSLLQAWISGGVQRPPSHKELFRRFVRLRE